MNIPKDLAKKRDELANQVNIPEFAKSLSERSGHIATYKDGFDAGVQAAFESEHVAGLVEALTYVLSSEPTNKDGKYCPINQHRFVKALEALAKWEKRNE